MLEVTLSTCFETGTNVKGDVLGADWTYLLPSRELGRVLFVGNCDLQTAKTLSALATRVTVACTTPAGRRQLAAQCESSGLANIDVVQLTNIAALGIDEGAVDLIVIAAGAARRCARSPMREQLFELLSPDAVLFTETPSGLRGLLARRAGDKIAGQFATTRTLRLSPVERGQVRGAVPSDNAAARDFFHRHRFDVSHKPTGRLGAVRRLARKVTATPTSGRGLLAGRSPDLAVGPPCYVRQIAAAAGVDLNGFEVGLASRGGYGSRKVLMFLFRPGEAEPAYVTKLTRLTSHNVRLENERQALVALAERDIPRDGVVPAAAFFGYHAGLAVLGQTAVHGRPFASVSSWKVGCPHFHSVVRMLTGLSAASRQEPSEHDRIGEPIQRLFDKFRSIYRLSASEHEFLRSQVERLTEASGELPVVLQHGDPGTWNVLIGAHGRPILLDWEATELRGVPLWDLLYLLRSYGVGYARSGGSHNNLRACQNHFLDGSPLTPAFAAAIATYCRQAGVPSWLGGPLFYTCWMHRAIKESTRLPTARLQQGHYVNLLRTCIDRQDSLGLRTLFGTPAEPAPEARMPLRNADPVTLH